jgi:hypothetical protein
MFRLASRAFGNYKCIAGIGAAEKAVVSNIKALNSQDTTLTNYAAGKLATVAQFYIHSGNELLQEIIQSFATPCLCCHIGERSVNYMSPGKSII